MDARIQELVSELDALIPRTNAAMRIMPCGNHRHDTALVGNRAGYLRFGIELLKAPDSSVGPGHPVTGNRMLDLDFALDPAGIMFQECILDEQLEPPQKTEPGPVGEVLAAGFIGAILLAIGLAGIGLITVLRWLW